MNPRDNDDDFYHLKQNAACYHDEMEEKLMELERQIAKEKAMVAKQNSAAANKAINDLCDALGIDLQGASINAGTGHISIPSSTLQLVADRVSSITEANALIEGAL